MGASIETIVAGYRYAQFIGVVSLLRSNSVNGSISIDGVSKQPMRHGCAGLNRMTINASCSVA